MTTSLVFLPLTADELRELCAGKVCDIPAHAATPVLEANFGDADSTDEDLEFYAMTFASLACLLDGPRRIVAVAEVDYPLPDSGDIFGRLVLPCCELSAVTSFYIDEPAASSLVKAAAKAAHGLTLEQAWDLPKVEALLETADLLWYDVAELDAVLQQVS